MLVGKQKGSALELGLGDPEKGGAPGSQLD